MTVLSKATVSRHVSTVYAETLLLDQLSDIRLNLHYLKTVSLDIRA